MDGQTVEVAMISADGSYCRSALGEETFFKLDSADNLTVVQPQLHRAAGLGKADILAFRDSQKMALERQSSNSKALLASSSVDPKIKEAILQIEATPSVRPPRLLLSAPSKPEAGATVRPRLVALQQALANARQTIASAGLSGTLLDNVTACEVDATRLPAVVAQSTPADTRTLRATPVEPARLKALESYEVVPLYDLMENFGVRLSMEPPR